MRELILSNVEKDFIHTSLSDSQRLDGRTLNEFRDVKISFGSERGEALVSIGKTKVLGVVECSAVTPYPDRPTEGFVQFFAEYSKMASPSFDQVRQSDLDATVSRLLDRGLRESRALDSDTLCILPGEKVWNIKVYARVLDHDGCLIDACQLASLAALLHYRRPDTSIHNGKVVLDAAAPTVPLSIHHLPIAVTFGVFGEGEHIAADPTFKEEQVTNCSITFIQNVQGQTVGIQKSGGEGLSAAQILQASALAQQRTEAVTTLLKATLAEWEARCTQREANRELAGTANDSDAEMTSTS
eukprot:GCRY01002653.1.p1 GENE.GCRY01002653.1~~GCRY01002653.1.p1  ORF type:complete len:299 (+),score=75.42 GCRY01002653.1:223-1119(+)